MFLGNHNYFKTTDSESNRNEQEHIIAPTKKGSRIPCPIDPSHTIYSANLQKHILVCAATAKIIKMKGKPYYVENCNVDSFLATKESSQIAIVSNPIEIGSTFDLLISKINFAYQNMMDRKDLHTEINDNQQPPPPPPSSNDGGTQPADFETVAENIRLKLRSNGISNSDSSSSSEDPLSAYWRLRHVEQDVALVKELMTRNILQTNSSCDSGKFISFAL